jgi:hypothetical protein
MGLFGGPGLSFALLLVLPLAVACWSRTPEAGVLAAWRGNLRRVLPLVLLGLALFTLGSAFASRVVEARWARSWESETEMQRVERAIGAEWRNPAIPPDSWRNGPPPKADE